MKVFISYSSGDAAHTDWVGKLADDLDVNPDFHVILDQYDLDHLKDKNMFMEQSVVDSDFIIVVATKDYKSKADNRERGVGYETQLGAQRHTEEITTCGTSNIIVVLGKKIRFPLTLNPSYT